MDTSIIQEKAMTLMLIAIISCAPKDNNGSSLPFETQNRSIDSLIQNHNADDSLSHKKLIRSAKVSHYFSSADSKDLFVIEVRGLTLIEGDVLFVIKNASGIEIYSDKFKAVELFNYELKQGASIKEKNEFILKRVDQFLNEKNFKIPAIPVDDSYDRAYNGEVDSLIWEKIKSTRNSIGFYYLKGEEDKSWITYDKVSNMVVKYQVCC